MQNIKENDKYSLLFNFYCKGFKGKILDKVDANRFGLTVQCMKVGEKMKKQMVKED
jgi:hypothetical protein